MKFLWLNIVISEVQLSLKKRICVSGINDYEAQ